MHNIECNTFLVEVSTDVFFYSVTGIDIYSHQGIDIDKVMESNNLLIGHKPGKEISVIERFVVNVLWKGIISCLWVHADARLDMGEKSIIFRSVTFQNVVQNTCNTRHVTHLQVELSRKLKSTR
jgi:hypothetical protein